MTVKITMESKAKVERAMEAVEVEVIASLIYPYGRAKLKSFPIIMSTSRKFFLDLSNYFKKKAYMQWKNQFCLVYSKRIPSTLS